MTNVFFVGYSHHITSMNFRANATNRSRSIALLSLLLFNDLQKKRTDCWQSNDEPHKRLIYRTNFGYFTTISNELEQSRIPMRLKLVEESNVLRSRSSKSVFVNVLTRAHESRYLYR